MAYIRQTVTAGRTIEVKEYHTYRFIKKHEVRGAKQKVTSEQMQEVNRRNAEATLRWKLNENFTGDDLYVTLTYSVNNRPNNFEELKKHMQAFVRKMRSENKKRGQEFKFVYVFEVGTLGAMHIHAVFNGIEVSAIKKAWKHGRAHIVPLDDSGNYWRLANYFIKYSDKTFRTLGAAMGKRYSCSRNLREPKIEKKVMKRNTFKKEPKEKDGFFVDRDSVQSGFDAFGFEFFSYILYKNEGVARSG